MENKKHYVFSKVPGKYSTETVIYAPTKEVAIERFSRDHPHHVVTGIMAASR